MAVEASDGTAGELLARAEMEMGGQIEHIACPDGDDNDGSGIDESFVMVMNGVDSDASNGGDLLAADSGSSNFVENGVERQRDSSFVDDDVGGGEEIGYDGERAEMILANPVEIEEVVDENEKTDHSEKGDGVIDFKASENGTVVEVADDGNRNQVDKDEKDEVIEELDTKVGVVDVGDLKNGEENEVEGMDIDDLVNKEQSQVEEEEMVVADSKNEKEIVIEHLNEENEVMMSTEETDVPYVQNGMGSDSEGLTMGVSSAKSSSSGPVDRNMILDFVFEKSDAIESEVADLANEEVEYVSEIEEVKKASEQKIGDGESSIAEKNEADSSSEIEERRDANDELSVEIDSLERATEETRSVFDIEGRREDNHEECEDLDSLERDATKEELDSYSEIEERRDANNELSVEIDSLERATEETSSVFDIEGRREDNHEECEDLDSSERDATNEKLDSYSEVEESKNVNDEEIKDVGSAEEEISAVFEIEDKRDDADSLARDTAKKRVDSNLEVEETKSTNDEVTSNVPFEITDHTDDEVHSVSEVGDRKIGCDGISNHIYSENEKNSVNQLDENLKIKAAPSVFDAEGGELNTSVEEIKQHNANSSQLKSEIEGKEDESSIELIEVPLKNDQSADSVKEFIISTSQAEVKNDEAMSTSLNRESSNKEWVSAPEPEGGEHKEDMDSAFLAEEKQVLDASFIDSKPELTGLLASEVEEIQDTDAPSVDSNLEPLKQDLVSASKSKDNQNAVALTTESDNEKRELKSVTVLADVVSKSAKALEVIEDQRKDLKAEKQSVESSKTEIANEKRELEPATELTEHVKNHPEKNFGIKEQQNEVKSDEKQDAAPSAQDVDGEKTKIPPKKYRLIKIARFNQKVINDEQQAKITDAQVQVDEHTRRRDSLKAELDNMRKVLSDYFHKRDSASDEEKKAKALLNAKRLEMDSVQTVISKGKTAASFLDIISQIHALEHKMQHETISLKDEKKYLHELNQLKHERELHLFNKCSQLEIDEALKQKEAAESSLRTLKKEFDVLRSAHLKADEHLKSASKSYIDQFNNVKEFEQKWKTVNELRQNAYKNLHSLKSDKMEHYWKYMDDRQAAKKYASLRDFDTLDRHCNEQIERIMRLWNEDDDFRRQYVESNANNTLRKFGTLDGRTLGPNDPKPVLPSYVSPPVTARSSPAPVTARGEQSLHAHKVIKSATPTNPRVRSKSPSEPSNDVVAVVAPSSEEFVEVRVEKKLTKEEEEKVRLAEEQARVEEELRKVTKELELKEKLRMEQKTKAKEAEERKRRKAEKAQAKAEYKAQKEADLRELKRSKKEKKKEGEKAGSVEGDLGSVTETSSQEASQEQETINRTSSKSSRRRSSAALNKYSSKVQPVPLHLRNRGKRNISTWIWTLCIAVALIALFFAGNHISFSAIRLNFGF